MTRALWAFIKGNNYASMFGSQSAQLLAWFDEFLLGLKFPHAVSLDENSSNRRVVVMTFLAAELYRYELQLKERAAALGAAFS